MIIKRARAKGFKPDVQIRKWAGVPNIKTASASPKDITRQASEILNDFCDPENYLFSHVTVVCSVDTRPMDVPIGPNVVQEGLIVNRKYAEYDILPNCQKFINNNKDAWERDLLLQCYKTFIGAHNFCFVPGTKVLMSDGTYKNIEEIKIGDRVISHTGKVKNVVHTFERSVDGEVQSIYLNRYKDPIICTGNHPFRKLDVNFSDISHRSATLKSSKARYINDQKVKILKGEETSLKEVTMDERWAEAASLCSSDFLLGNTLNIKSTSSDTLDLAYLLGYYLSEGCVANKYTVVFSYGHHEENLAKDTVDRLSRTFPKASSRLVFAPTSLRVEVTSQEAVAWFLENGYKLSHSKKINEAILEWDRESLLCVLVGWLTGDGNYNQSTKRLRGVSVSFDLIHQMKYIADLCGIKTSVTRINVPVGHVSGVFRYKTNHNIEKESPIISRYQAYVLTVSSQNTEELMKRSVRWKDSERGIYTSKDSDLFRYQDKRVFKVKENKKVQYAGKVYNFEVEDDNSYVVYPGVAVHNCEHLQIEEQSKGKIVDAVARDIGESVYVDILIATAKKHKELITAIKDGRINAVSMGCSVLETQCTKCGNTSPDDAHMCRHINMMKGQKFEGPDGQERMIAELCGNKAMHPHGGVRFIEASWVKVPAFKGAVLRNIIDLADIKGDRLKKVASDLRGLRIPDWNPADAPRIVNSLVLNGIMKIAAKTEEEGFAPVQTEQSGGEENPLESLEKEMMKVVINNVKTKLLDIINPPANTNYPNYETPLSSNNNIVRVGSEIDDIEFIYNSGLSAITNLCKTNKSRLRYSKVYNDYFGIHIPKWIYVACHKLGPLTKYTSPMSYISVCERVLNRRLSMDEIDALLKISSILREEF